MKNFTENTKLTAENYCSEKDIIQGISGNTKKSIFKAGLTDISLSDLCLYMEALVELINERKRQTAGKD